MVFGLALYRQMTLTKAQYWLEAVLFPFPRHSWRWGWQFFIFWRGWNQEDTDMKNYVQSFFFFFLNYNFEKLTERGWRSILITMVLFNTFIVGINLVGFFCTAVLTCNKKWKRSVIVAEEQILREKFPSLFQGFQGFATVFRAAILQTWPPQIIASSSAPLVFFYT